MGRDIVLHDPTPLSAPQVSALAALAGGATVTAAASAKVDRTTVHRWLSDDPELAAAVNRSKQEACDAIRGEVRAGAAEAIKVVREIMANQYARSPVRLRAALALLSASGALDPEPIGPTDARDIKATRGQSELDRLIDSILS